MTCSWRGCKNEATQPQRRNDETIWANLCDEHHAKLEAAIEEGNPMKLLGYWSKAGGFPQ